MERSDGDSPRAALYAFGSDAGERAGRRSTTRETSGDARRLREKGPRAERTLLRVGGARLQPFQAEALDGG